jgi:type IV pilus assembly protein PilM
MPFQHMPSLLKSQISLSSLKNAKLSDLRNAKPTLPHGAPSFLTGHLSLKRRRTVTVGLDIQPGYIAAAQVHKNGSVVIERAAAVSLGADTVREGEVLNQEALVSALKEVFAHSDLPRHVRIGVANQRTVMRMLEVPPLTDPKELAAAVRFQAEDQVPMPLNNAVLDYRALGIIDTPAGPRQRVLLVAAQRDMVEKLLGAAKSAGLHVDGIDLSAFALIRSLYKSSQGLNGKGFPEGQTAAPVLHLNVGGLTNMAIAEESDCRFTRVLARGLEAIAAEVAERRGVPIDQARELLRRVNLSTPVGVPHAEGADAGPAGYAAHPQSGPGPEVGDKPTVTMASVVDASPSQEPVGADGAADADGEATAHMAASTQTSEHTTADMPVGIEAYTPTPEPAATTQVGPPAVTDALVPEMTAADPTATPLQAAEVAPAPAVDVAPAPIVAPTPAVEELPDVRLALEVGVRGIASEVRNSLDFYQSQEQGPAVSMVYLSGPALDIPGFGEMLELNLGVPVQAESVVADNDGVLNGISIQYLAIAAGLAVEDVAS